MWLLTSALAASPYKGLDGDVAVKRTIAASPEAIAARLGSTRQLEALFPTACVESWVHGAEPAGPARVTYRIKAFKRRLTARLEVPEPGRRIELDHDGNKGFVTRFLLTAIDGGTEVQLTTFLTAPGWPFRKYYFDAVKPDWTACWETALARLEESTR